MAPYPDAVEQKMKPFANWPGEKHRRRYAAVAALKLGHGGIDYIARLLGCDPKTIRQGMQDLDQPEDPAGDRVRKNKESKRAWSALGGGYKVGSKEVLGHGTHHPAPPRAHDKVCKPVWPVIRSATAIHRLRLP
jgi:hypothetical protein